MFLICQGAAFWFLFLGCWAPTVGLFGTTMWAWVFRGCCLANLRKPFENISCWTWFSETKGVLRWNIRFCGSKSFFCSKFVGQGFWIFGTPVLVSFSKYCTQMFDMLASRYVNCWHTASWFWMTGLYVCDLSRHHCCVFVFEMLDPDSESRVETLPFWAWFSEIKEVLRWDIRFCGPKICFRFSKVVGQGFWISGTPLLVFSWSIIPRVSTCWGSWFVIFRYTAFRF